MDATELSISYIFTYESLIDQALISIVLYEE